MIMCPRSKVKLQVDMGRDAMSDERNTDETAEIENNGSVNRRRFVKSLSAGAATAPFAIGTGSAKASEAPWEYDELTGRKKLDLLDSLRKTSEFDQLRNIVRKHGGEIRGIPGHSRAGRLTAKKTTREIISIELKTDRVDDAYLTIGRDVDEGVSVGMVEYNTYAEDGVLQKQVVYDAISQDNRVAASEVSVQSTETDVTKKVVTPEAKIRKVLNGGTLDTEADTTGGISTMAFGNGPCDECKWAVPLICQNACGAGGGFACGFFGLISGGIGGVGCLTIVSVVCSLASYYACSDSRLDNVACSRLGLC